MANRNHVSNRVAPDYFEKVAAYYDRESLHFEERYQENQILQLIRHDFRRITEQFPFHSALEIGSGPGLDLVYFAKKYPATPIYGLDVSAEMVTLAKRNIEKASAHNVQVIHGHIEQLPILLPGKKVDLIYCYYGALNTVRNLEAVALTLRKTVSEKGTLVLSFINRWYLFDILWNLLRGRTQKAFSRINNSWVGYSPDRPLASTCRSAREIKLIFKPHFNLVKRKGYSIIFPAWYRAKFIPTTGILGKTLWQIDRLLNKTPCWNLGEYSLYVFQPK